MGDAEESRVAGPAGGMHSSVVPQDPAPVVPAQSTGPDEPAPDASAPEGSVPEGSTQDPLASFVAEEAIRLGLRERFPDHPGVLTPVVLRRRANALIRLDPVPVVARVANWTASVRDDPAVNLRAEVNLSRWAASRGGRVPVPLPGILAGPHERHGVVFTMWRVRPTGSKLTDPGQAGRSLAHLHQALAGYPGALPGPEPIAHDTNVAMMMLARMGFLDTEEAMLVADECRELVADVARLTAWLPPERRVPLHGDAHPGNAYVEDSQVYWSDFEDTWRGPVEWDVATLASSSVWTNDRQREIAVRQYAAEAKLELDEELLTACRRLRNAQGEAWRALAAAVASS